MKTFGWRQGIILIAIFSVVVLGYFNARTLDMSVHQRVVAAHVHVGLLDARLNQEMLKARTGALPHYDSLVLTIDEERKTLKNLQDYYTALFGDNIEEINNHLSKLKELLEQQSILLEDFKSDNSILRNSLNYFPNAVSDYLNMPVSQSRLTAKQIEAVNALSTSIMAFVVQSGTSSRSQVESRIEGIEKGFEKIPLSEQAPVRQLVQHGIAIIQYSERVDSLLNEYIAIPYRASVNKLQQVYLSQFQGLIYKAENNRLLLFMAVIIFLAYITYILLKLRKAGNELKKHNVILEETVTERTKELVDQNSELQVQINERERAEQQVQENEKRMAAIFNTSLDCIVTTDDRHQIIDFNPAAEEMFKIEAGQTINKILPELLLTEKASKIYTATCTIKNHANIEQLRLEGKTSKGKTFPIEVSMSRSFVDPRNLCTVFIRDMTEQERVEKMKREFISTVSHELRTPMTSIRGSLELIRVGAAGDIPEKGLHLIGLAEKNADRLLVLINDILDIEKLESGKMRLDIQRVSLKDLIKQAVASISGYAERYQVTVTVQKPLPEYWINADSSRIIQVLNNLLSNAIKFSPEHEIVELQLSKQNTFVRVSVTDHGEGIPAKFCDRIFGKFAQADSSDTRNKGGSGLGLNIAKALIEQHNGQIGFTSDPGVETTFYFELQIADISELNVEQVN